MRKRATTGTAVVCVALLALAACGDGGSSGDAAEGTTIKIGFVGALTGPLSPSGQNSLAGLKAGAEYVEQHNPGTKIVIEQRDTKGEPTAAVAATRALAQDGVSALYFTTEAFPPVQDVLNQVKVPGDTAGGIGSIAADVGDSKRYKYAFSTGAGTSGETSITPLLSYAASAGKTVAVLDDSSAFGTSQTKDTLAIAQSQFPDVKIVQESFPNTASDVTAQLNKLKDAGAESLIVWSYGAPLVATMSSLNKIGWNPQMSAVLGIGDPATTELIPEGMKKTLAAGPIAKTFLSSSTGDNSITADFVKLYLKAKGKTEFNALDSVGAVSFDWALLVTQAAQQAKSTEPDAIKKALVSGGTFKGANGTYTFGPDKRIGIDADQLGVFVPAQPCPDGKCVEAAVSAGE
ncbi:ABC transporter substrate-binding protein [Nonomuraea sp. LP-02]|uniref:ABC transporter substrate-binding protein n=1 Tax=Nonomuraea sp. LP-02 TaxID=3097960 RepID=UPI002E3490D5|nr:ABC transporter substrate-binding protein [Nonomuraea sp. LP-02]MED7925918.1 ABC transporter substrate-binding protein [Nonomuraea sp. LP-02]